MTKDARRLTRAQARSLSALMRRKLRRDRTLRGSKHSIGGREKKDPPAQPSMPKFSFHKDEPK
jgi:hypothetical protein